MRGTLSLLLLLLLLPERLNFLFLSQLTQPLLRLIESTLRMLQPPLRAGHHPARLLLHRLPLQHVQSSLGILLQPVQNTFRMLSERDRR